MDDVGKTCPYCQTPIKPGEEIAICDFCGITHHRSCWNENRGCTTYGCRGSVTNTNNSRPVANPTHNNSENTNPVNSFNAQNTPYTVNSANMANNSKSTQILLIIFGVIIGVFITYYFINNSMGTTADNQENRYSQTQDNHYQTNNDSQSRGTTNYNTESSNINEEDNIKEAIYYHYGNIPNNLYLAYNIFSKRMQAEIPWENWIKGFPSTLSDVVEEVEVIYSTSDVAVARIIMTSKDISQDGQVIVRTWEGQWRLVIEEGQWKLDEAEITKTNEYIE